jgi:hypothetical protein
MVVSIAAPSSGLQDPNRHMARRPAWRTATGLLLISCRSRDLPPRGTPVRAAKPRIR